MTQTGWIIVGVVVLLAIIVLSSFLRRKPEAEDPETPAARPAPAPVHVPPQTVAAEETPVPPPAPPAAPVVEAAPEPVVTAEPAPLSAAPVTAASGEDNLLRLKGVGPKIAALLKAEGVTRYAQIAGWSDADIASIDGKLGSFAGRPVRDNWVDQARLLAAGDTAGYEAKYGKL